MTDLYISILKKKRIFTELINFKMQYKDLEGRKKNANRIEAEILQGEQNFICSKLIQFIIDF